MNLINESVTVGPVDVAINRTGSSSVLPDFALPRTIHFLSIGIIIPIGLFFNTLSFVVFATSRSLRKSTTGHYLLSLAVADSVFLIGEFLRWLNTPNMQHLGIYIHFMDTNDLMCRLIFFVRYVSKLASAWITVAITIERFLTVVYPLRVARISTPTSAKLTIGLVWLCSLLMGMFPLWTVAVLPYDQYPFSACLISNEHLYNIFNWISLRVGSLLLPGFLMLVFTILIGFYLGRAKDIRLRKLSSAGGGGATGSSGTGRRRKVCLLERQLTIMLLAVAVSFIIFRLPYTVAFYMNHYKTVIFLGIDIWGRYRVYFAYKMTDIFVSLNYASNFFLYCWCGSTFRKQLRTIFVSRRAQRRDSSATNSSLIASSRNGSLRSNAGNQVEMSEATKAMLEALRENKAH
ncbi:hypothetical protein LSH36_492g06049 [Paralvinella palmiformis]|uniref:G-protein coupled receptors family 1 profile domain-containing protein n=1 Tax=Paralvinella palmiformis TaxID=53620 RepID=A0AAD9J9P4_9ANNE|nr:hypothetical protein LSH36_492g06049 [Paralvinella palmiformis]